MIADEREKLCRRHLERYRYVLIGVDHYDVVFTLVSGEIGASVVCRDPHRVRQAEIFVRETRYVLVYLNS